MKVKEFIEILSKMPEDAEVIYQCCSEYEVLKADDPTLVKGEDKVIALRNGRYMRVPGTWLDPKDFTPTEYVTVVTLPGN